MSLPGVVSNPYRYVSFCAWGGPIVLIALIMFWGILGQNIPPYSAGLSAEKLAQALHGHMTVIRAGMILSMAFGVFYFVWGVGVAKVMAAIEQENDVLSTLQLWGAGFTTLVILLPCSLWLTAVFRPLEIDPQLTQLLYDAGWMFFDVAFSLTAIQLLSMGICFDQDRRPRPLVPKWVAWYTIWVGFMLPMLGLIAIFRDGAFSRSGLLNYWMEFPIFFLFVLLTSIYVLRAIRRLEREHSISVPYRTHTRLPADIGRDAAAG